VTHLGFRKGTFLRGFMYDFIEAFAPHLTRERIEEVLQCATRAEVEALFESVDLPTY